MATHAHSAIATLSDALANKGHIDIRTLKELYLSITSVLHRNPFQDLSPELIAHIIKHEPNKSRQFCNAMVCSPTLERLDVLENVGVSAKRLASEKKLLETMLSWIKIHMNVSTLYNDKIGFFLTIPEIDVYNETLHGKIGWLVHYHEPGGIRLETKEMKDICCTDKMHMIRTTCTLSAHHSGRPVGTPRTAPFPNFDAFHVNHKPITYFNADPFDTIVLEMYS